MTRKTLPKYKGLLFKEHDPHMRVGPWVAKVIELYRGGQLSKKKLKTTDLASLLTTLQVMAINPTTPRAILADILAIIPIVSEKLIERDQKVRKRNAARQSEVLKQDAPLLRRIKEVRERHPDNDSQVARVIEKDPAARNLSFRQLRRKISQTPR